MLLAYLDESFTDRYYWIVALLVPAAEARALSEALDAVVESAAHDYGTSPDAELHGHDLYHRAGDWKGVPPRVRVAVYSSAISRIAEFPVEVIARGVERHRLVARYVYPDHPHEVALSHLLERVDEYSGGSPVLVIADEVSNASQYRRDLWYFQRYSTGGYRKRRLINIVDTMHFAPSSASRLVQAADLIAFLWQRYHALRMSNPSRAADRAVVALWESLQPRVRHTHCWYP